MANPNSDQDSPALHYHLDNREIERPPIPKSPEDGSLTSRLTWGSLLWPVALMIAGAGVGWIIREPTFQPTFGYVSSENRPVPFAIIYLGAGVGLLLGSAVAWIDHVGKNQARRFYLPIAMVIPLPSYLLPWAHVDQANIIGGERLVLASSSRQIQSGVETVTGSSSYEVQGEYSEFAPTPLKFGGSFLSKVCVAALLAGLIAGSCLKRGSIQILVLGAFLLLAIAGRSFEVSSGFPMEQACNLRYPITNSDLRRWYSQSEPFFAIGPQGGQRGYFSYTRWFPHAQLVLGLPIIALLVELAIQLRTKLLLACRTLLRSPRSPSQHDAFEFRGSTMR
jgi:hypothetical protein